MIKKYCLFIPSLGGGGAEKVVALLANYLAKKENTEVFLVVLHEEGKYWQLISEKVKVVNLKQSRVLKSILPFSSWIKDNKPDVIFSALSHVNVVAAIATKMRRHQCKLILSEHSTISQLSIMTNPIYRSIFKFFYSQADYIVAVSKGVMSDVLKTLKINPNKIIVINNPVCPNIYTSEKVNFIKYFNKNPGKVILSIGRLESEKNYLNLLEAFRNLNNSDYYLVILGEGSERKILEDYILNNKLDDRVILPGFVKDPFIWINSADLFVSSSNKEGFGNAIVEAMAYGINIVSTDCVGPREILKDGELGLLVEKNNPKYLAEAIIKVLKETNLFDKDEIINRANDFRENLILSEYENIFEN